MNRRSIAGWPSRRRALDLLALTLLLAAAFGLGRSRPGHQPSQTSALPAPAAAAARLTDPPSQTWLVVVPPPAPRVVAPLRAPEQPEITTPDWKALAADLADSPAEAAIRLAGPTDLKSGLSERERLALIAAGQQKQASPKRGGRGVGGLVVGRGTPRGGGVCY